MFLWFNVWPSTVPSQQDRWGFDSWFGHVGWVSSYRIKPVHSLCVRVPSDPGGAQRGDLSSGCPRFTSSCFCRFSVEWSRETLCLRQHPAGGGACLHQRAARRGAGKRHDPLQPWLQLLCIVGKTSRRGDAAAETRWSRFLLFLYKMFLLRLF